MKAITVTTKAELKEALEAQSETIDVEGDLAKQVHRSKQVKKLSAATLTLLGTAIAAVPFTGGASFLVAVPIAAATGVAVPVILTFLVLGIALVLAIWGDYDEIEYQAWPPRLRLKRKRS